MGEDISGLSKRDAADKAIASLKKLSEDVNIPSNIQELGVKKEDFDLMAGLALDDGNADGNPIQGKKEDIVRIFEAA